jgi:hypothetical protein
MAGGGFSLTGGFWSLLTVVADSGGSEVEHHVDEHQQARLFRGRGEPYTSNEAFSEFFSKRDKP